MNFIEIKRTRPISEDHSKLVRISFLKCTHPSKLYSLSVYIGKDIAAKMGLKAGNRITILHEENNNKIWKIRKSNSKGYKLLSPRKNSPVLKFQLTWRIFEPNAEEVGVREVSIVELTKNHLIVDAQIK